MPDGNGGNGAGGRNSSDRLPLSSSSSSRSRKKVKKVAESKELFDDLLGVILKKLNFDDLYQFGGVCQSWRLFHKTYWKAFKESKSPFIVQKAAYAKKSLSFISLPDTKSYSLELDNFWGLSYCGSSCGYLIFGGHSFLLLMNPFTRTKKIVCTLGLKIKSDYKAYRSLLTFMTYSKEFVIVVYSTKSVNVYRSKKDRWVCYSNREFLWKAVDVVVFRNDIYVLTSKAMIGVLNLNLVSINFLELGNTPIVDYNNLKFVRDGENLLLVHFMPGTRLDVYKIDFSIMEYVKLKTLGDLALFYSLRASCRALRNPSMWGYCSNHVYSLCGWESKCKVYSWDNVMVDVHPPDLGLQVPNRSRLYWLDWCFRNLHD